MVALSRKSGAFENAVNQFLHELALLIVSRTEWFSFDVATLKILEWREAVDFTPALTPSNVNFVFRLMDFTNDGVIELSVDTFLKLTMTHKGREAVITMPYEFASYTFNNSNYTDTQLVMADAQLHLCRNMPKYRLGLQKKWDEVWRARTSQLLEE